MDNIKQKNIELLAPAGGLEQLKAAVSNGADAVYIGGEQFNARINATNFSITDMRDAICYAHPRGVRIFVAINILLEDSELQEAIEYVAKLYEIGIDAVIVQDLGLAYLINKHLPEMPMHLSTQGSVYNRSGVKNALNLGFERVVLAREMTLQEIKTTTDLCEIEVFVHGAMCMSYSGQCQMSRNMGGRSGNRGECAQPCRLKYKNENGVGGYFLSPKDICQIDSLGQLIEAGVASLKIEGRMKSPEYVAIVVGIYRKYIDEFYKNGCYTVSEEDRESLQQIFSRGEFSTGYLYGNPGGNILSGELSKHQGIYVGKVIKSQGNRLLEVKLTRPLDMGDIIEIRGKDSISGTVTYIKEKEKGIYIIGDIKGNYKQGSKIYRVISKKQLAEAQNTYIKCGRKSKINIHFKGEIGKKAQLSFICGDYSVRVESSNEYERAINRPLTLDKVKRQLLKLGETPYETGKIEIDMEEDGTIALSEINEMRRKAVRELETIMSEGRKPIVVPKLNIKPLHIRRENLDCVSYSNVTKGKEDEYIEQHLVAEEVILNNIGWIEEFRKSGAKVYAGSGMNVLNGAAQEYLESIDVKVLEASEEQNENSKILMTTEHPVEGRYLIDRKGIKYKIKKSEFCDKFHIEK